MTTTTATLTTLTTPSSAVAAAAALSGALNGAFVERADVVRALLVALVAGEHVCLLGDPGTAKSAITNALTRAIGGAQFSVLMTKFTVPEEVFGPISLVGLEHDQYRRVTTGYLPEAEVGFVDECFKANSAILNSMLTLINERLFDNGGTRVRVPLEILVGASNEVPADESLNAFWDRFMLRLWVHPIRSRDALRGLLAQRGEPTIGATLSPAHLAELRAAADGVILPGEVLDLILDLRDALAQDHGITASDRRWRKAIKLVRASAALAGRAAAVRSDVLVLVDALWRAPDERPKVLGTLTRLVSPDLAAALRISDAAGEALSSLGDLKRADSPVLGKVLDQIRAMIAEIRALNQDGGVAEILAGVEEIRRTIARSVRDRLGADIG